MAYAGQLPLWGHRPRPGSPNVPDWLTGRSCQPSSPATVPPAAAAPASAAPALNLGSGDNLLPRAADRYWLGSTYSAAANVRRRSVRMLIPLGLAAC